MILEQIVAAKRAEIEQRRARISSDELRRRTENLAPPRAFGDALRRSPSVALIAEIKPASPARGELRAEVNPTQLAGVFEQNGAKALSVLTDRQFFQGEPRNLTAAHAGTTLPILRKDFILDEYQVYESRALQADALLLIVRLLDDVQLREFRLLAEALGMTALVEVHDEAELERALVSGASVIGINNRNLADLTVDLAVTERLAPMVPKDRILVSESGIFVRADVERVARAGAEAVLVGEALMRAQDIGAKTRELATVAKLQIADHGSRQDLRHYPC